VLAAVWASQQLLKEYRGTTMSSVIYEKDQDNIVHLILDKPYAAANLMDNEFTDSLCTAVEQLRQDDYAGVILRSAKSTFFAGGNLDDLYVTKKRQVQCFI
jgi:3-hydroxyacyl-CoA dehydrogenase/enoyl-CoA hydratase/3-hydroxybutyryl-CoA epimerase